MGGGISTLYPGGDAQRCPHDLSLAITAALQVLGFIEAPPDEVPDENIWHHPEMLEEWFEAVKQRRESGMKPIDSGGEDEGEMLQNPHTRGLREG